MGSAPQLAALATELQAADLEDLEFQVALGEQLSQHLKMDKQQEMDKEKMDKAKNSDKQDDLDLETKDPEKMRQMKKRVNMPSEKLGAKAKAFAAGAGPISAHDPVRGLKSKIMSEGLKVHYPGLPAFGHVNVTEQERSGAVPERAEKPSENVSQVPALQDPPETVIQPPDPEVADPSHVAEVAEPNHVPEPAEPRDAEPAHEPEPVPEPACPPTWHSAPSSSSMDHNPDQWHDWTPMIPDQWGDWDENDWEEDDDSWGVWNSWGCDTGSWQEWGWSMSNRKRWAAERGFKRKRGGLNKEFFAEKYGRW